MIILKHFFDSKIMNFLWSCFLILCLILSTLNQETLNDEQVIDLDHKNSEIPEIHEDPNTPPPPVWSEEDMNATDNEAEDDAEMHRMYTMADAVAPTYVGDEQHLTKEEDDKRIERQSQIANFEPAEIITLNIPPESTEVRHYSF
jgi:hypothetical protein